MPLLQIHLKTCDILACLSLHHIHVFLSGVYQFEMGTEGTSFAFSNGSDRGRGRRWSEACVRGFFVCDNIYEVMEVVSAEVAVTRTLINDFTCCWDLYSLITTPLHIHNLQYQKSKIFDHFLILSRNLIIL